MSLLATKQASKKQAPAKLLQERSKSAKRPTNERFSFTLHEDQASNYEYENGKSSA